MTTENWKSRSTFLVLLALSHGPKHGYEIARHLEERTNGFFTISYGALYPVLHKLEKDELVTGDWQEGGQTKRRKVYRLTRAGKAALAAERDRYQAFAGAFGRLIGDSK